MSAPEIGTLPARRLTREQAEEAVLRGETQKPDLHDVWNEELQRWLPLGRQVALEPREADPAHQLQQYDSRRTALLRFVAGKLVESEYTKRGMPIEGRLHDFYKVPGSSRRALTKLGAEKLSDLLGLRVAAKHVTASVETSEYCSARVRVDLVDRFGRSAGSHEAAASTAEAGFRSAGARRKYGAPGKWEKGPDGDTWVETGPPDFRAALNDVVARAGKRAFVGAVIVAAAADEIFEVASEGEDRGEEGRRVRRSSPREEKPPAAEPSKTQAPRLPCGFGNYKAGTLLLELSSKTLTRIKTWCGEKEKFPELIEQVDQVLEERRLAAE